MTAPSTMLHPLSLTVVGFKEEDHDYHFHAEAPEPQCCEACGTIGKLVRHRQTGNLVMMRAGAVSMLDQRKAAAALETAEGHHDAG